MSLSVRVRFAPAPTGALHLGNVRAALLNYLFARQHKGAFIIRIEDTDAERMIDPGGKQILAELQWLAIGHDEGPDIGGPYGPYLQSERATLYAQYLGQLQQEKLVYRCFCSVDELEKKRQRQIALKQPPRYDRVCTRLSVDEITQKIEDKTPFIWRFMLPHEEIRVIDLARGSITYNLKNFSDFPLTRQDGSFTFIFANCIDDFTMRISHVFRGEEHISNTANQAALYRALRAPIPTFWHFPIICNVDGKKLSKRDFGFSLSDLRKEGFLPEAITNYLAIIGAGTRTQEVLSLEELVAQIDIAKTASAGSIRYDVEKLRWINHQWIGKLPPAVIAARCRSFLRHAYPQVESLSESELLKLIAPVQKEMTVLADVITLLEPYFVHPTLDATVVAKYQLNGARQAFELLLLKKQSALTVDETFTLIAEIQKGSTLAPKEFFTLVRIGLTGLPQGLGIKELLAIIPHEAFMARITALAKILV